MTFVLYDYMVNVSLYVNQVSQLQFSFEKLSIIGKWVLYLVGDFYGNICWRSYIRLKI